MKALPLMLLAGATFAGGVFLYRSGYLRPREARDAEDPIRLVGVVSANDVVVSAKIQGRIERLAVREGTWVRINDLIAELDAEELWAEEQSQQARVAQLAAKLAQSRQMVILEQDRAREQLSRANAQVKVAESQFAQAVSELNQLRSDAKRYRELLESGIIARQEVERQLTLVEVGEANVRSADDRVRAARADLDLCRANQRQVRVASETEKQTVAELEESKAQLDQASARVRYVDIRAPQAGLVSLRVASQGEVIKAGDPIVTIVDLDDIWVRTAVEESRVGLVTVGQSLRVQLASGAVTVGTVTLVSPEAEFATQRDVSRAKRDIRTFGIKVQVPNPERRIHPGMTAYVFLPLVQPSPEADSRRSSRPSAAATARP